ncbi:MAG TPA: hypothetical protein VI565_05005, partial [Burkholderiales bacterium]|nr:hypothetical protein [Burkholderiales bacterium]
MCRTFVVGLGSAHSSSLAQSGDGKYRRRDCGENDEDRVRAEGVHGSERRADEDRYREASGDGNEQIERRVVEKSAVGPHRAMEQEPGRKERKGKPDGAEGVHDRIASRGDGDGSRCRVVADLATAKEAYEKERD